MKKVLSIALSVAMIFAMLTVLTGCSEQKKLIGTWETTVDLTESINKQIATDEATATYFTIDKFELVVILTFNENGTYKMSADEDSAKAAVEGLRGDLEDGLKKMLEDQLAALGANMTVEQALALSGTTMDAMLDEAIPDDYIDNIVEEMASEGKFEAKDGKIYMSDDIDSGIDENVYDTYELNGDTLKLLEPFGLDEDEVEASKALYPMTFKKAA